MSRQFALLAALLWVVRLDAEPASVADLVKQLGDPKFAVREAAQKELLKRGEGIVPELDRLAKGADAEAADRIARVRYNLVGYKDDIRRLIREELRRYGPSSDRISDELRGLIAGHQPGSGDLLLSLVAKSDSETDGQGWRTFRLTWESHSAAQVESYVRETLSIVATHRSQVPARGGMLVRFAPQLRFGPDCWPPPADDRAFAFRARASLLVDGKPVDEPCETAYPTSGRGWFRVPHLSEGKHTIQVELKYEFTHRSETRTGRVCSRPEMATAGSDDDATEIWAKPFTISGKNYFRAAFRVARPEEPARPIIPERTDRDPASTVWWRTDSGGWAGISCPRWAVTAPLDVDLCFDAEFRDPRSDKVFPAEPILAAHGEQTGGYLIPRDFAGLARGRSGNVRMKLVLTPSREVAQFGPGLSHCYPEVIEFENVILTIAGEPK
jgi:hypothetical protein